MLRRPLRRAVALSLGALLLAAGTAAADTVFADADTVTPLVDGTRHLGDVAPGGTVSADVRFVIVCAGLQHVDADQSVVLTGNGGIAPEDGAIVSASTVTLAPLTTAWAADAEGCPDPVPSQDGGVLSHVVLRAPTTAGMKTFTIQWARSLSPAGSNDANAFSRTLTSVNFTIRVIANTAPVLTVPASFSVEGDTPGGWASVWSVSATDAEDSPDPAPSCTPAAGSVLPLGTTTVTCSVADSLGASDSETFDVTVVDTTAPVLSALPADMSVTTSDPTGRTVDFTAPGASDIVDPSPAVACDPPSGARFGVGTTTVTCTATDASGNRGSGSFTVTVAYEAPPPSPARTASAVWLEPVAGDATTFVGNRGRTIPVKVRLFVDGQERSVGDATLRLARCGGTTSVDLPMSWSGGRWNVSLDTSGYPGACYTVEAWIDGIAAGAITLELRGDAVAKSSTKQPSAPTVATAPAKKAGPKRSR